MGHKRDEFVAMLKQQLDQWNERINALEIRARQRADEAELQADLGLAELRRRREDLKGKLQEMREASDDAWTDLRAGAERARDALEEAISKARARLEDDRT